MPQIGKLTLEKAQQAMTVLHLHFQANTNAYPSDTEKVLGVAAMLSGDALDWFGKVTIVMYDISPKISGKLQLGESNSGPDSEGCGDPAGPWAACLGFSWLDSERAETGIGSNPINQGILQACLAINFRNKLDFWKR
ncbi:hypothetical protein DSO57_1027454 [Entomophthora muscae]|uniref:Uncharacterized protein n=1 Tax=Entomophthora muscae TaxID=34485 RepID=A0ACC2RSS7_9FUNG|nr:hypothetical protein DSO57_1027454 [Entomophthora muscae]